MLLRYAPGHMREETSTTRLNHSNVFTLDRLNTNKNFESGLSATLGFDYELEESNKKLDFSIAQIINEKENKDMPSSSSLDQRFSDVVGHSQLEINDNIKLSYNFAVDQNYGQLNYNELGANLDFNPIKFDINYLQEKEHVGDQEYFKGKINFAPNEYALFSAETKRNLITNSAEYYNLSYEYTNDCLRAGLVYRREFYNDSELEPEDSLMFKITLTPFGKYQFTFFQLMNRLILFLIIIIFKENISFASIQNKILVNIGNQIITSYELKNRVKTVLILNNKELNQANIDATKNES